VAGQTNKQIAQRLSRSERTIEYHRNRLMRKMAAHNAAELVRHALVTGII
jgi:DNA-binding NarL/FixJ family response regulator